MCRWSSSRPTIITPIPRLTIANLPARIWSIAAPARTQCLKVSGAAVKHARAGRPPQLVVASTLRLAGHGEHDDASYVTDDIKRESFAQDALQRTEQFIVGQELLDRAGLQQMRTELAAEVDEAVATAQQEDAPV